MAAHARTSTRSDTPKTPPKRASRNSSVETLRILAMLMIVASHCVIYTNLDVLAQPFGINKVLIETFLYSGGGQDRSGRFFSISAWYLSDTGGVKAGLRRVWLLEREMLFWSLLLLALSLLLNRSQMTATIAVRSLFPTITGLWWYPTAYAVFLVFFPFLAAGLRALGQSMHGTLAVVMLFLFTGLDLVMPLSTVGLRGGNYMSFIYLYVLISYYRWYMNPMRTSTAWRLLIGGYALLAADAIVAGLFYEQTGYLQTMQVYLGKVEFRLPVLMVGLALFALFERHEFHNAIINTIAASTFGVYLISEYPGVRFWIWWAPVFDFVSLMKAYPFLVVPAIIGATCVVFLICALADQARELVFSVTINRHRGRGFDCVLKLVTDRISKSKEHA